MAWTIAENRCLICGGCVAVCPVAALELRNTIIFDEARCTRCGVCEKACPVDAIKVSSA